MTATADSATTSGPKADRIRNVWSEVRDKVENGQTQRVVVNLRGWGGDLGALQKQFDNWPVDGLKELTAVTSTGTIAQLVPRPE